MSTTQKVHKIILDVNANTNQLKSLTGEFKNLERELGRATGKMNVLGTTFNASQAKMQKSITATANASNKATTSSINSLVRHIRQVESFAVALYMVKSAYDLTLGRGFEFNKMLEQETTGLKLLIAQNLAEVDSMGKKLTVLDRFTLAQGEANRALEISRQINIETPHNLADTIQMYKLLTPQVLKYGGTLEEVGLITKRISILAAAQGVSSEQLFKTLDSSMSGQAKESDLTRALAQFGLNNDVIKAELKSGGSVVDLFIEKLKGVELAGKEVSEQWEGITSNFTNEYDSLMADLQKPIFESWKQSIKDMTALIHENKGEWVTNIFLIGGAISDVGALIKDVTVTLYGIVTNVWGAIFDFFGVGINNTSSLFSGFFSWFVGATGTASDSAIANFTLFDYITMGVNNAVAQLKKLWQYIQMVGNSVKGLTGFLTGDKKMETEAVKGIGVAKAQIDAIEAIRAYENNKLGVKTWKAKGVYDTPKYNFNMPSIDDSEAQKARKSAISSANKDYRNQAKDIINEEKYGIKIAKEKLNLLEEQHKQELLLAEIKAGGALSDREQRKFDIDYLTQKLSLQEESIKIAKEAWEEAKRNEIKQANELGTPKTEEQRRIKENTLQKLHANVLATEVDYQKQITEQKEIQRDLAVAELSDMDKIINIMKNGVSDLSSSFADGGVQGFADGMKNMMGSMIDTMKQSGDMITMLIGYAIDIFRGLFNNPATQEEIDKAKGKSDFSDDSIRNLGDMFANVQYPMLEVTNKMYKNIRNMDNNFQSVARAITGKASASGIDLTGANFVQTNDVGFLGFSSESVSLIGTGLQFQLQKLTDMMNIASLSVKGYTSKLVESSSFWGLFSDSDVETTFKNLPASVKKDIAGIFASGYESILMAGVTLGFSDENIKNALATAELNLAKIDFTGLSPAEVNDRFSQAVSEAFSGVINGIDMFTGLIDRYATANEYALETLTRIATEYDQVNYSLSLIGKNLTDAVGGFTKQMQVLDIVASTGGLQNFNDAMGSFMANFYDSTEQFQFLEKSMAQAFATLGLVAPKSNVEFRNLLEGMDTTTEQGAYLYGQVLLLADGFNQMTTAGKNLGSTLQDALKKISDAYLGEYSPYTMLQKTQYATEVARVARENGTSMDSVDAAYQALVTSAKSATKQEDTIRQFNAYIAALEKEIPDATNRDIVNELEEIRKAIENQTERIRFTA